VHYFFNGVEVFPGQQVSITPSSGAAFTVSSTANGCSKTYNVQVSQNVTPPGAQIGHNGLILDCNHPSLQLVGAPISAVSYAWSVDGGGVFSTQQNVEVSAPGTYCLTVTGSNGCTSTSCVLVTEMGSVLSVMISLLGNPCTPEAKTLVANTSGGVQPFTYAWSTGGTGQSEPLPPGFAGTVTVSVTDGNSCTSISAYTVAPALDVLALTNEPSGPGATDGYIDLFVLSGQNPISFAWSNGSTTEDVFGLTSGTYSVVVMAGNGCTFTLTVQLGVVGTNNPNAELAMLVTPNPAQGEFAVQFSQKPVEKISLRLFDLTGRLIAVQSGNDRPMFSTPPVCPMGYISCG
jgi:hypothetical protein